MTREDDDDLYTRHQMLAALVNALVHDLRNPLHSATLLVEAMGSPSADVPALRTKMRAQIGKLDGLIAETAATMKQLALEPRIGAVDVDVLLRFLSERVPVVLDRAVTFVLPPASGLTIAADRKLVERVAVEIAAIIAEQNESTGQTAPRVVVGLHEPEPGTVRLRLGDLERAYGESLAKAPFAIGGGGIRLAMAHRLAQNAGATLRLESGTDGVASFTLLLRKPD